MITITDTQSFKPVVEAANVQLDYFVALEQTMLKALSQFIPVQLQHQYNLNSELWVLHRQKNDLNGTNGMIFSDPLAIVSALLASGQLIPNQNGVLVEISQMNCQFTHSIHSEVAFPPILLAKSSIPSTGNKGDSEVWGFLIMNLVNKNLAQAFVIGICNYLNNRVREFGIINPPQLPILRIDNVY